MKSLEKIDAENEEFYETSYKNVVTGKYSTSDITGFDLEAPNVFIPRVPCAHVAAESEYGYCTLAVEKPTVSILTLLPLYNTLIFPIFPKFSEAKVTQATFEKINDIAPREFLKAVWKGRIIPYFTSLYQNYDNDFLQHFLEPGLPRISSPHMSLIRKLNTCSLSDGDCEACNEKHRIAEKDVSAIAEVLKKREIPHDCISCLFRAYAIGISKETLLKTSSPLFTLCATQDVLASRNIDAAFQTNCPNAMEALSLFAGTSEIPEPIDTIVKGLKVKYTRELDFESYLELLDGKTTRAIKKVTERILEDPFASKYSEQLNSKIFEFNREIEEVAKSKTAKFFHAVSDIAVYGGSKFVERRTKGYIQLGKEHLQKASEWLASKLMDFHARATGKDWTIAQLYRTRWKLAQCKKLDES